jgi:hypothetical protein
MSDSGEKGRRRGPVMLSELVGKLIDPATKRRGFATTDLIAAWPEIVGTRFADCTRPEKIVWPKGEAMEGAPALLVLRVDGPKAILVQHEAGQIIERVNAFLGYGAVGHLRIVQAPLKGIRPPQPEVPRQLAPDAEARLAEAVAAVPNDDVRAALSRLGRGILTEKQR